MRALLGLSTVIDVINEKIGVVCNWLVPNGEHSTSPTTTVCQLSEGIAR